MEPWGTPFDAGRKAEKHPIMRIYLITGYISLSRMNPSGKILCNKHLRQIIITLFEINVTHMFCIPSCSFQSEVSSRKMRKDESPSSQTSPNDSNSLSFSRPRSRCLSCLLCCTSFLPLYFVYSNQKNLFALFLSGEDLSSHHSLSHVFLDHRKQVKNYIHDEQRKAGVEEGKKSEAGGSSIAEEVLTAADDSLYSDNIPSINEKGNKWQAQLS